MNRECDCSRRLIVSASVRAGALHDEGCAALTSPGEDVWCTQVTSRLDVVLDAAWKVMFVDRLTGARHHISNVDDLMHILRQAEAARKARERHPSAQSLERSP